MENLYEFYIPHYNENNLERLKAQLDDYFMSDGFRETIMEVFKRLPDSILSIIKFDQGFSLKEYNPPTGKIFEVAEDGEKTLSFKNAKNYDNVFSLRTLEPIEQEFSSGDVIKINLFIREISHFNYNSSFSTSFYRYGFTFEVKVQGKMMLQYIAYEDEINEFATNVLSDIESYGEEFEILRSLKF